MLPPLNSFRFLGFEERTKLDSADVKNHHIWISKAIRKTGKDRMVRIEPNLTSSLDSYRKESGPIAITGKDGKHSKNATSQTSFGRTHWIFSGIFGGFSTDGLSMKSGFNRSIVIARSVVEGLASEHVVPPREKTSPANH